MSNRRVQINELKRPSPRFEQNQLALGKPYSKHDIQLRDFSAGLHSLTEGSIPPAAFRDRVHRHILGLLWEYPLTHVLLAGESASHDLFRAVIVDALAELSTIFPQNNAQGYNSLNSTANSITVGTVVDPTFAAARGAALYARQRQDRRALRRVQDVGVIGRSSRGKDQSTSTSKCKMKHLLLIENSYLVHIVVA